MKRSPWVMILPLLLLLAVAMVVAGCGSGGTSTTGSTAMVTSTTAGSSTTAAGGTATTAAGGTGMPSNIVVQLTGDHEVPPVQTDATGTFTLILSMGATGTSGGSPSTAGTSGAGGLLPPGLTVSYKLEVNNIKDATAAHIHLGAEGQNGEVIYALFTGPQKNGSFSGVLSEGPLTESNLTGPYKGKTFADLVAAVLQGQTYVNVHTVANPNGEIRGQIVINLGGASTSTTAGGAGGGTPTSAGGTTGSGGY